MKKSFQFLFINLFLVLSFLGPEKVYASNVSTDFPSCANPQGQVIASYNEGIHGIAGRTETFSGKDSVYLQSNGNALQCFCPVNGQGIQTNWLKASSLTDTDIAVYKSQGYIFIPNGSLWGLSNVPYLAKNIDYSCNGGANNTSSGSSNNSVGGSSSSSDNKSVLAVATGPFAPTGNIKTILALIGAGFALVLIGFLSKKNTK